MAYHVEPLQYPLELGWAYLLLAGYLARVLFASVRLPGAVGVLLVGYAFSHFMQEDILAARDDLQHFAFFLVLLNAGFEVNVHALRPRILVISLLPGAFELLGIAAVAVLREGFTVVQGLVLGCVLFPLGEGLVIPKLGEFKHRFPEHPLPKIGLVWAPLEATMALAFFGFLEGLSHPDGEVAPGAGVAVAAVVIRIVVTVAVGAAIGAAAGWLLSNVTRPKVRGRTVFTGSPVEAFLVVLGLGLAAFGAARVVPMGFAPGEVFNPDLLVIALGSAFGERASADVLHGVDTFLASIWVFGSIILFSMLGSKTSFRLFTEIPRFLPFMVVGLACRLVGICVAVLASKRCDKCKAGRIVIFEILFFFLCCLPRATLQGALGGVPVQRDFFRDDAAQGEAVREFVSEGARLYIVMFSISGSLLLEFLGPKLLRLTGDAYSRELKRQLSPDTVRPQGNGDAAGPASSRDSDEPPADALDACSDDLRHADAGESSDDASEEAGPDESEDAWKIITVVSARSVVYRRETL